MKSVAKNMLRVFLFLIFSFAICRSESNWEDDINAFIGNFDGFKSGVSDIINNIDYVINDTNSKAKDYVTSLGSSATFQAFAQLTSKNPGRRCLDNVSIMDTLESFPFKVEKLQVPLKEWKQELQWRIVEAEKSINLTWNVAKSKTWLCQLSGKDCTADINKFVEKQLQDLRCKQLGECNLRREKRSSIGFCDVTEFKCDDGQCISGENACNGYTECEDGSDEPLGCTKHCFGGFHCRNLNCLSKKHICNGKDDCGDGSDEEGCPPRTFPDVGVDQKRCIMDGGFLCDDGSCLSMNLTCDGTVHCKDQSDELGLCQVGCSSACPTVCLRSPRGPQCVTRCPEGFKQVGAVCEQPEADLGLFSQLSNIPLLTDILHTEFSVLLKRNQQAIRSDLKTFSTCEENISFLSATTSTTPKTTTEMSSDEWMDELMGL